MMRSRVSAGFICVAALTSSACVSSSAYMPLPASPGGMTPVAYPKSSLAQYEPYMRTGTATILGQAFLTTRGGEVRLGAGKVVTLDPLTDYSRSWYAREEISVQRFFAIPPDSLFSKARRSSTVDAQGKFSFTKLPPGNYLVRSIVSWEVANEMQGGVVGDTVSIAADEERSVLLHTVIGANSIIDRVNVPLVTVDQLGDRKYGKIGRVSGKTCDKSKDMAIVRMQLEAKDMGADAILGAQYRLTTSPLTNICTVSYEAIGDAIKFAP